MEELFDEYLRLREAGDGEAARRVLERAGEKRRELRERIELHESLEGLGPAEGSSATPDTFGRFQITSTLAEGGMSRVLLARDPRLGREVAVKVLAPFAGGGTEGRAMLLNEARALAHLHHPGVVRVYEVDEHEGDAFLAMERIQGPSLAAVLSSWGRADAPAPEQAAARALEPLEARCRLVRDLARALDYCHARGVIHRDVKPGNVLLNGTAPVLIDFGLATVLGEGHTTTNLTQGFVGTPAYISPEQVNDRRTGASALSDQFSLGIVLYQLLTLHNPFDRGGREATLDAVARAEPAPPRARVPHLPRDLERIVLHCLEKVPQERYPSVGALAEDLQAFLDGRPISIARPSAASSLARFARRHRREVTVAASALALAMLSGAAAWAFRERTASDEIGRELARLRAQVEARPAEETPATWERTVAALAELGELERRLEHARSGWIARLVRPDRSDELEAALDAASARMRVILDAQNESARARGLPFDRRPFQAGLDLLRQLHPDDTRNQPDWQRGRVLLDPALERSAGRLRLLEQRHARHEDALLSRLRITLPSWIEVPYSPLLDPERQYRAILSDESDAILWEWSFFGPRGWEPALVLAPPQELGPGPPMGSVELDRDELRQALSKLLGSDEVAETLSRPQYAPVPSFSIALRRVRWPELASVLGQDEARELRHTERLNLEQRPGYAELHGGHADPDGPACVPLRTARAWARARGVRLPSTFELALAWQAGMIREPQAEPEWTGDGTSIPGLQVQFDVHALDEARQAGRLPWEGPREEDPTGGVPVEDYSATFRVARGQGEGEP